MHSTSVSFVEVIEYFPYTMSYGGLLIFYICSAILSDNLGPYFCVPEEMKGFSSLERVIEPVIHSLWIKGLL